MKSEGEKVESDGRPPPPPPPVGDDGRPSPPGREGVDVWNEKSGKDEMGGAERALGGMEVSSSDALERRKRRVMSTRTPYRRTAKSLCLPFGCCDETSVSTVLDGLSELYWEAIHRRGKGAR